MAPSWLGAPWPGGLPGGALAVLVGAAFGSFIAAAAARLIAGIEERPTYRGRSFWLGRSICPACGATIAAADLVPIVSYLRLGGRCRFCRVPIGLDYTLIEAGSILAFLAALASEPTAAGVAAIGVLGAVLAALAVVDARHQLLPDWLSLPLLPLGLAVAAVAGPGWAATPVDAGLGAGLGAGLVWLVRALHMRLRGIEGVGLGDVKLMAVAGTWVGWQGLGSVLLLAAMGTLAAVAVLRLAGRATARSQPIPFGPGIAAG
jgi:leader peptidase (prepilin peptidase)/N-methyltransferase